jgi:hypothetical protein
MKAVHNYTIFLHSLYFVQYRPSSVYKVYGFLYKKILWLSAQPLMHRLLNLFIKTKLLSSRRLFEWPKLGARSGEYGGCGRHSKFKSSIVATVARAVWGPALSCCNRTLLVISPRRFDLTQVEDDSSRDWNMRHLR